MSSPLQREAWEILRAVLSGQRTEAVCRAVPQMREKNSLLEAVRSAIREELEDMLFIAANRQLSRRDSDNVSHCLLVTTRNIRSGILVNSQGYNYARYAAEVPDKSVLDLRDVPVDHYDLKLRQPRSGPER